MDMKLTQWSCSSELEKGQGWHLCEELAALSKIPLLDPQRAFEYLEMLPTSMPCPSLPHKWSLCAVCHLTGSHRWMHLTVSVWGDISIGVAPRQFLWDWLCSWWMHQKCTVCGHFLSLLSIFVSDQKLHNSSLMSQQELRPPLYWLLSWWFDFPYICTFWPCLVWMASQRLSQGWWARCGRKLNPDRAEGFLAEALNMNEWMIKFALFWKKKKQTKNQQTTVKLFLLFIYTTTPY